MLQEVFGGNIETNLRPVYLGIADPADRSLAASREPGYLTEFRSLRTPSRMALRVAVRPPICGDGPRSFARSSQLGGGLASQMPRKPSLHHPGDCMPIQKKSTA